MDIYKSAEQDRELNSPAYFSTRILEGANKQLSGTVLYADQASGQVQSDYSSGGSSTRHSAGPDTLTKIVRHANIDLEALIHEDGMLYPWRYSSCDTSGNMNYKLSPCQIRIWLYHHTQVLSNILGTQFVKYLSPAISSS